MQILELEDIQGYIIRDYRQMLFSRYALLRIADASLAKKWISKLIPFLTTAETNEDLEPDRLNELNIAFTVSGVKNLGLSADNIFAFSKEFREGMVTEHRTRILGDYDDNDPKNWSWGGTDENKVDVVLMVFGKDKEAGLSYYDSLQNDFLTKGFELVTYIDGLTLNDNKEHFGFRDGISQPVIKGSGKLVEESNMLNAGEFLMGYKNEYNVFPQSPLILNEQGNLNLLPTDAGGSGKKDLGKNCSYLVIRQIEQKVEAFWSFMNEKTKNQDGSINNNESIKLAAKMMGRWPSGAPITKFPDADPGILSNDNDFGYAENDKAGNSCPFGSHIRRLNPRDSFEDNGKKQSIKLSNRHRIIRRSRLYGEPIISSPTHHKSASEVGLLFNCFNADISRQFEFIQNSWASLSKVKNLYNDPDPIIGTRQIAEMGTVQNFTIQACPVNKTITDIQRFVTIKGGAYFFFPSITSIRYLCSI
jgi:Dyp-type peroxidase family